MSNRSGKERGRRVGVRAGVVMVGFAEFLFLMRLCIAGAQFLSARWEGKSARYGGGNSEKSNASAAGVFRRLEQAGAANIALLVDDSLRWVRLPPAARIQSPSSGTTRITRAQTRAKSIKRELCGD